MLPPSSINGIPVLYLVENEPSMAPIAQVLVTSTSEDGESPLTTGEQPTALFNRTKRTKSFVQKEDELLAQCYLTISQDPAIGKDQTYFLFWERIAEKFVEADTLNNGQT